jgi:hypothetical protein
MEARALVGSLFLSVADNLLDFLEKTVSLVANNNYTMKVVIYSVIFYLFYFWRRMVPSCGPSLSCFNNCTSPSMIASHSKLLQDATQQNLLISAIIYLLVKPYNENS